MGKIQNSNKLVTYLKAMAWKIDHEFFLELIHIDLFFLYSNLFLLKTRLVAITKKQKLGIDIIKYTK